MRAFLEHVESGAPFVKTAELAGKIAPDVLEALRRAGVLRPSDDAKLEEVSLQDLARVVRALYAVEARGLTVPSEFNRGAVKLGWNGKGLEERQVLLVVHPTLHLHMQLLGVRRTLVLVPTARHLRAEIRAKHGPGAYVTVEALEESLAVHGGRLARADTLAPDGPGSAAGDPALAPAPALASAPRRTAARSHLRLAGAKRWNEIAIARIDDRTVLVELPGHSLRLTYVDLGFAHPRSREPTRLWELLLAFCEGYGIFQSWQFGKADATKKLVSRLGVHLQRVFALRGSPYHPYRPAEGWRTRFQAHPRPSRRR